MIEQLNTGAFGAFLRDRADTELLVDSDLAFLAIKKCSTSFASNVDGPKCISLTRIGDQDGGFEAVLRMDWMGSRVVVTTHPKQKMVVVDARYFGTTSPKELEIKARVHATRVLGAFT